MRAAAVVVVVVAVAACHTGFVENTEFGDNPGGLRMFERDPFDEARGLVVFLHGCSQDHSAADASGLSDIADDNELAVVAPEQSAFNNPQLCFDWFRQDDVTRSRGEAESIREMIAAANVGGDKPVVVVGLSAGAAMAVAMAAAYPDVVDGAASFAGGPYGCAEKLEDSAGCLAGLVDHTQDEWRAFLDDAGAPAGFNRSGQRMFVGQGTTNPLVNPKLADALVAQWADASVDVGDGPTHSDDVATDKGGAAVDDFGDNVRRVLIDDVGHTMPIGGPACGEAAPFVEDVGFCAMRSALSYLGIVDE